MQPPYDHIENYGIHWLVGTEHFVIAVRQVEPESFCALLQCLLVDNRLIFDRDESGQVIGYLCELNDEAEFEVPELLYPARFVLDEKSRPQECTQLSGMPSAFTVWQLMPIPQFDPALLN
jgi:hypothetical protein